MSGNRTTPVKYRPCILPLSQAALIFVCFNSVLFVLLSQQRMKNKRREPRSINYVSEDKDELEDDQMVLQVDGE